MTIEKQLSIARADLDRVSAPDAATAQRNGALLIDIRPIHQRSADGEIPGALVIDRNVLEWRLDPVGPDRIADIAGPDQTVIVLCDAGYASSLAAASLRAVGLKNATDLDGGFQAWRAAGLPTTPGAGQEG